MIIITLIALLIAYKLRFKRFSFYLWLVAGFICFFWEIYLFITGARHYNFSPALELPYHALTEAGPGLIIMILFAHKIGLIDISEYMDDNNEQRKNINLKDSQNENEVKLIQNKDLKKKDVKSINNEEKLEND